MRKWTSGAAAGVLTTLTAASLGGCGGSSSASSDGYCHDVASARSSFVGLSVNAITQEKFDRFATTLHTIRDEAPSDVKPAWTTFSHGVDTFRAALSKTGLTMDDLAAMQNGHMASGADMDAAMRAAQSFSSIAVANAEAAISTQVRQDCDVNLDPTG